MTTSSTRERRDWTLLIFIIPIGIILMLIAGQVAIRLVPIWSIKGGMQSKLNPDDSSIQQSGLMQPLLPAIQTPLGWFDTFLTPGAGGQFPPFVVFEPSVTPVVTASPPTVVTKPPTIIPVTDSPTVVVTPPTQVTPKPPVEGSPTPPTAPPTATPPTATPPTATPPTATPPTATPPTTVTTPTPSTPPVTYASVTPPANLGVNVPPDGTPAEFPIVTLPIGAYTVVDISGHPIDVSSVSDGNYDLIFYEAVSPTDGTIIHLDHIIIGVSNSTDGSYYEVFNWGDNIPDTNTNVDTAGLPADPSCTFGAPECDNRDIPTSDLYPGASGPSPSTGILIDVDTAPVVPPEGSYNYLVIISPPSVDSPQIDSVVVTEVDIASVSGAAPVSPLGNVPMQSMDSPAPPIENAPAPPADNAPSPPVDSPPDPPADSPPSTTP